MTAEQLAAVFNHVNTYIETRYQNAIRAKNDFSNPPTLGQVQMLIDIQSADLSRLYENQGFNDDISDMDTFGATNMEQMFSEAFYFNQPIGDWDVRNVTNMQGMFSQAEDFNQPIGNWDVGNVTTMEGMFGNAHAFNQPIGRWDVGNVTDMGWMFYTAVAFNQPIGDWDVSNVTDMVAMFGDADAFNQPIGDWDVSNVTNMQWMFFDAGLSRENYDSLLAGWARRVGVVGSRSFDGGDSKYTQASAREYWTSKGWTITDGGVASGVTEGTAGADTGSAPGNPLNKSAETGAQILHGLAGADVITGGTAADIIHGGADNDTISGGGGADEIHGAAGDDALTGGADADTFVFGYPNAGNDTITDFTTGASGDLIDISLLIESYVAGSSTLSNFVTATTSGGTTTLTIDPNGDGITTDQVTIILTNVSTTVEALVAGGNLKLE